MANINIPASNLQSGNPNGFVAGKLNDFYKDSSVSGLLYICSVAGNAASAVWQQVGSGAGITYTALNDTIVIDNTAHTIGGGYIAGANVTITGNSIAASAAPYTALNNTIVIDNTGHTIAGGYVAGANVTITGNSIAAAGSSTLVQASLASHNLYGGDNQPTPTSIGSFNTTYGEGAGSAINNASAQFNTLVGYNAGTIMTTQNRVTAIGQGAASASTSNNIVAIGPSALINATGNGNIGIGTSCMPAVAGSGNIAIGNGAASLYSGFGTNNIFFGSTTGSAQTNYSECTFLGTGADATTNGALNSTAIGYNTQVSGSNFVNIGNSCYVGVNNPIPQYTLDLENVFSVCAITMQESTIDPTYAGGTQGTIYVSTDGRIKYNSPVSLALQDRPFLLGDSAGTPNLIKSLRSVSFTTLNSPVILLPASSIGYFIKNFYLFITTGFAGDGIKLYTTIGGTVVSIPAGQLVGTNTLVTPNNNGAVTLTSKFDALESGAEDLLVSSLAGTLTAGMANIWIEYVLI